MSTPATRYVIQDYDYVLLIASWGLPREYRKAEYLLEVEIYDKECYRRIVISNQKLYYSSTAAMRDLLREKLRINNLDILIFVQDTILLDKIIENEDKYFNREKEFSRYELEDNLLYELYHSNREVAGELGVHEAKDYRKFVRFVPGVIATRRGAYVYSWRGEWTYDVLRGLIAFYTYERLENLPEGVKRIAILLDTTHGINYFVTALKEGVFIGATLYAFSRLVNTIVKGGIRLDEITIYHYNSDPIRHSGADKYSLKIHLLDKIHIVKQGKVNLARVQSVVENLASAEDPKSLRNWLDNMWEYAAWDKIIYTLTFFSKGLFVWALRVVLDIDALPEVDEIEKVAKGIKLKFVRKDRKHNIDYIRDKKTPVSLVVEYFVLTRLLKSLAEAVRCKSDENNYVFENINEVINRLENELREREKLEELVNTLKDIMESSDRIACLDLEKLINSVEILYDSPYTDININELEVLKKYLLGEEKSGWDQLSDHVYIEPRSRHAFLIDYGDLRVLISIPKLRNVNPRHFYAHAGLAYGLHWFGIGRRGRAILCLGDYKYAIQLLHTASIMRTASCTSG